MLSKLKPLEPVKEEDFLPVNVNEETLEEFDGDSTEKSMVNNMRCHNHFHFPQFLHSEQNCSDVREEGKIQMEVTSFKLSKKQSAT